MQAIPQIEPITRMARDHKGLIEQLGNGPVILAQHSKATAVLVSVSDWNDTIKRLEYLERLALAEQRSREMDEGLFVTEAEAEEGFRLRGII